MGADLSIVIVNWNTRGLLRDCLGSLAHAALPMATEIIVVDNASHDGSVAMLRAEFPDVRTIANAENVGYARANNQALSLASGRYLLLLNGDTRVSPAAIGVLIRLLEARPEIGACAPRLVGVDGTPQPFAFGGEPNLSYLLRRGAARWLLGRGLHDWGSPGVQEVDWASGACLLVRREVFDAVGPLDGDLFMYFEDVDWCLRMRRLGWRVVVQPEAVVTHIGGQSLKQNAQARRCYYRSLSTFYRKHYGLPARALMKVGLWAYCRIDPHLRG